jgi:hypothetical protein
LLSQRYSYRNGTTNQAKPLPAQPPVKANSNGPSERDSTEQYPEDTQHTVGISKLPAVTVAPAKRDWADWAYWGFNLLLVAVGGFQVYLLFCTLRAVNRQAEETGRQVEVTAGQLRAMNEQITEMSVQSGILKESVDVARDAAETSKKNIALVINKERARIMIVTPEKLNAIAVGSFVAVDFKLLFYGTTPAYEVKSKVSCTLSESKDSCGSGYPHGIHELPTVVSSSDIKPLYRDFVMQPLQLDGITLEKINRLEMFLHFAGVIQYNDFMEKPRETAFHYRWAAPDSSPNSLRRLMSIEGWSEVGGDNENYYT